MKSPKRDILMVVRNQYLNEEAIEQEVEQLNEIGRHGESTEHFCKAHELVNRNRITQKPRKILNAIQFVKLPAFKFLINKN